MPAAPGLPASWSTIPFIVASRRASTSAIAATILCAAIEFSASRARKRAAELSGPVTALLDLYLSGVDPPDDLAGIRKRA